MIPALLAFTLVLAPQDFEVEPERIAWDSLDPEFFDQRWRLPKRASGRDLAAEMSKLAGLTFRDGEQLRTFGDLVVEARDLAPEARSTWLKALERRAPQLTSDWGQALSQLFLDEQLFSEDWEPSEDHPRDGILTAEGWKPVRASSGAWRKQKPRFEQAATLFNADLGTIKRVENDYRTYLEHVGADYRSINPVRGGHLRGVDDSEQPFRFVRIGFRCDLPFPFSSYSCDLRILNRIGRDGNLRTDIYSTSSDFNYMAGRDVFLPVRDSSGGPVAYLLVRDFGFDIDNVPDGPKHRTEALRSALGNLKRKAEKAFRTGTNPFPTPQQALSELKVVGKD